MNRYIILFFIAILSFMPTVFAGDFSFNLYSPDETIEAREMVEVSGTHQLVPDFIDKILPDLWMSQYSTITIIESPDWIAVSFPDSNPITPPDGTKYHLYGYLSIEENAPMNTQATIELLITTGRFMRTIFSSSFPLCEEYTLERSISIQTGEWTIDNNQNEIVNNTNENIIIRSSRQEGIDVCFFMFILLLIMIIILTVFFIIQRYP